MELTRKERLFLVNQFRILQHLMPKESTHYEQACKILEHGYSLEYGSLFEWIWEHELSNAGCREVIDILQMHTMLRVGYRDLADKSGIDEAPLKFRGFDGNEETAQMDYAQFLIRDQGKWEEYREMDLNSHWPTLDRYRRMLQEWNVSADRYHLTKEDISRIVGAGAA